MDNSLTAAKESGATIEIDGKKVALGVPGAKGPAKPTTGAYPNIPLRRGGSPDEAASSVLLYVPCCFFFVNVVPDFVTILAWPRPLPRMFLDTLWRSPEVPVSKNKIILFFMEMCIKDLHFISTYVIILLAESTLFLSQCLLQRWYIDRSLHSRSGDR